MLSIECLDDTYLQIDVILSRLSTQDSGVEAPSLRWFDPEYCVVRDGRALEYPGATPRHASAMLGVTATSKVCK